MPPVSSLFGAESQSETPMPDEIIVIFPSEAQPIEVTFEEREIVVEFPPSQVSGLPGKTAYKVAVENGFVGSEAEWLASLVGAPGDPGPAGPNEIGGFPIVLDNPKEMDTIQLKTAAWRNVAQEALTDGGNF